MREFKGQSILDFPGSYVVIDVETTGLDPSKDELIEIAALKVENDEVKDSFCSLVKPNVILNSFITNLTGITNQELASAPMPKEVLPLFYNFVGDSVVVGHNVNFDINFLYDNFVKYMNVYFSNNYIDTLRLSKRYFKDAPSYKLSNLAVFLKIPVKSSHRALTDCYTTNLLFQALKETSKNPTSNEDALLSSLNFENTNPFYCKKVVIKGIPQFYSYAFMKSVLNKCGADIKDMFYSNCDYIIFSNYTYTKNLHGEHSEKFEKALRLSQEGKLIILSEKEWCDMLNLPIPARSENNKKAKDITTDMVDFDTTHPLYGKLCVFTGTLEKMTRKEAMQIVVDLGGCVGDSVTKKTNYLILGNNDYCPSITDGKSSKQKKAETLKLSGQDIDIISENVFYDMVAE